MEKKAQKTRKEKERAIDKKIKELWPLWAFIGTLVLMGVIFYFIFSNYGKISYEGMEFAMEKYGTLLVYHYSYMIKAPSGQVFEYNLYLRNNPKENSVPVYGKILYPANKIILIGINGTGLTNCNNSIIAVAELSEFLTGNLISIKGGNVEQNQSMSNNTIQISCDKYPENPVIIMQSGNETKVERTTENCYVISAANCEILKATEKFIVQSLIEIRKAQ